MTRRPEHYLQRAWRRFWIAALPATLVMVLMMVHMLWVPVPGYLAVIAVLAFPVVFLYGGWGTHVSCWRSLSMLCPTTHPRDYCLPNRTPRL